MIKYSTKDGKLVEFRLPARSFNPSYVTVDGRKAGLLDRGGQTYIPWSFDKGEHFRTAFKEVDWDGHRPLFENTAEDVQEEGDD